MSLAAFFEQPLWSRLAAMHWHFLWQGLLIAWLYWTVVKLFAIGSARARYLMGMTGLLAMMLCTIATFWLAEAPEPRREQPTEVARTSESEPVTPSIPLLREQVAEGRMDPPLGGARSDSQERSILAEPLTLTGHRPQGGPPKARGDKNQEPFPPITTHESVSVESSPVESPSDLAPILLGGWFLGVMIFGIRLLGGMGTVVWCRWSSWPITDPKWVSVLNRLSLQLGLTRPPRLAVCFRAGDAFSLGLFRPLIVLPAAWLLQLPPHALESVLAHELAHIRRWDAWANLFQRVLEAWLFYHPAVWWLSRQLENEREKCCDLWAVSLTGDRLQYVKTLAGVAEFQLASRLAKFNGPILATSMGGRNMVLLERVRHILGETPRTGAASRFLAGTLVLGIPAALWVGTLMLPASAADEEGKLVAQAEGDQDGNRRRDGDAPKAEGQRDGDRPRPEGQRDGDRPRPEGQRDGDRPRPEGQRDSDRPRPEGQRDGDRPRPEGQRDGERREGGPREGEGRPVPGFPPRGRDGGPPRGGFPMPPGLRDGERPGGGPQAEMMLLIRELRREVEQLRNEVRELREARGERPRDGGGGGGGARPDIRRPGGERPRPDIRRPEGEGEGDRPRVREEGAPETRRPQGERREEIRRPEGERREGDRAEREGEGEEPRERLEKAREEREEPSAEAEKAEREKVDE
jgi:hypothetical protein